MDEIKLKEILLSLLIEFDRICKNNNLRYFLVGGTAIGAVRHKGFIPWDDDVDVAMPRPDYEWLQKIPPGAFLPGFELTSFKKTSKYYHDILKLERSNTTLITRISPLLYIGGVFLDIFPFDGTPNNKIERERHFIEVNKKIAKYIERCFTTTIECKRFGQAFTLKTKQIFSGYKVLLSRLDLLTAKYQYETSEIICSFHGVYGQKEYTRKKYFDDYVLLPFETGVFRVPIKYHEFLTGIYDDYLTPPPVEQQKSQHEYLFVDLERRWLKNELKAWIKSYKVKENFISHLLKFCPLYKKFIRLLRY